MCNVDVASDTDFKCCLDQLFIVLVTLDLKFRSRARSPLSRVIRKHGPTSNLLDVCDCWYTGISWFLFLWYWIIWNDVLFIVDIYHDCSSYDRMYSIILHCMIFNIKSYDTKKIE